LFDVGFHPILIKLIHQMKLIVKKKNALKETFYLTKKKEPHLALNQMGLFHYYIYFLITE